MLSTIGRILGTLLELFERSIRSTTEIVISHITAVNNTVSTSIGFVCTVIDSRKVITTSYTGTTAGRALNEIVGLYIGPNASLGIATKVITTAATPVINHIVDILVEAFHLVVTGCIIGIEITIKRHTTHLIGRLAQTTGRVRLKALAHYCLLYGDVSYTATFAIGVDGEGLVFSPRNRAVVKYHVLAISNTGGIFSTITICTHANTQMTNNNIVRTRE